MVGEHDDEGRAGAVRPDPGHAPDAALTGDAAQESDAGQEESAPQDPGGVRPRRRGRRPAGEDTRAALLAAARAEFIEQGYDGATVRAIARRAGVDPAMVNHWFGGKEGLFTASVIRLPIRPSEIIRRLLDGPPDAVGERMVRTFLTVWDASGGGQFTALVRSVTGTEMAATALREVFVRKVFRRVVDELGMAQGDLRATLCGSQIVGLGMARYVLKLEPLASTDIETVVTAIAPNLQRYITGDIGVADGG
ncbi:transcriptional regulator, TetR family [Streptoalloteichus hindustanus]|uniref:Transcriptional regulator, TetR family n=1 Tax=Streptoalloteichus hindustanus TaxID=2017 RepID=A0A1M5APK0_STRHI|nr:transcriptional regulator, TetR family [Streptoalloteichus hindustanus]